MNLHDYFCINCSSMSKNEKIWHGDPDKSKFLDLDKHRHFALIVTDNEVGGIQEINVELSEMIKVWERKPYVVEIPEQLKGKVLNGWYYSNGEFRPEK